MDDIKMYLWIAFGVSAVLYVWVGKSFISQPDYNAPEIFKNPFLAKVLVLAPQLGFLLVIICGFAFTSDGWWFLGSVIATAVIFSTKPGGY